MITVDARGENCPIPVIKTKKTLDTLTSAEVIEVLVDNEIAVQNVTKLARDSGGQVESMQVGDNDFKVTIQMESVQEQVEMTPTIQSSNNKNTIVVISTERMGEGNDELGTVLLKGFIFALTQLQTLPKKIIFYNGGATLPCEGSDSLEDLQAMAAEGVEILTCGTCLDYYHLKEKLAVGEVTNMYSIVEAMNEASTILKP
jgi:selenium metabolism protein YedF